MYDPLFIGIDIGSSFIKLSLIDSKQQVLKSMRFPSNEMKIKSEELGWAEQEPEIWWKLVQEGLNLIVERREDWENVRGIGISYQMHGLVMVDYNQQVVSDCIIWCDGRATQIGTQLHKLFIKKGINPNLVNHPSNFTLSKLVWVKRYRTQLYNKIYKIMLPGDFIAMKLSGKCQTTQQGLSEAVLWDYSRNQICREVLEVCGIDQGLIPQVVVNFGEQSVTSEQFNKKYGLSKGIGIYYRCGDQPNNAFSLNVLQPGEIAATAGTSGTIFAVCSQFTCKQSLKFNSFLHVNHTVSQPRIGKLLCINGCGSVYQWVKNLLKSVTYDEMNKIAKQQQSDGVLVIPFGNGPERMINNCSTNCHILDLDFQRHSSGNIIRGTVEGIAFSFVYGAQLIKDSNMEMKLMKAGRGNLFQCEVFCQIVSTLLKVTIEIYQTNGAEGAAKGALLGYLKVNQLKQAEKFKIKIKKVKEYNPLQQQTQTLQMIYEKWREKLLEIVKLSSK